MHCEERIGMRAMKHPFGKRDSGLGWIHREWATQAPSPRNFYPPLSIYNAKKLNFELPPPEHGEP